MSIDDTCEIIESLLLAMNKNLTANIHLTIKNIHLYATDLEVTENVKSFMNLAATFHIP